MSEFYQLPRPARLAVIGFGAIGCFELIRSLFVFDVPNYASFGLMLFLAIVTSHTKFKLIGGSTLSLLTSVVLTTLMLLGMEAAVLVGVCGVLVQSLFPHRRFVPHNMAFNIGMITVTVMMAGYGYQLANDPIIGALAASFIYYLGNSIYVSLIVSLSAGKSLFRVWHDNFLYTAPSFFIAGLLALLAFKLASTVPAVTLIVVVPILYLSYCSYRVYFRSLEEQKRHALEMSELYKSTLSTLALAIDAKDRNTHGHIQRVQKYARSIAEAMKLADDEVEAIATAALLHDIGKLAVPEYILSKAGPLTPDEMHKMRLHPQLGAEIISNIKFPYPVADTILAHHERFNGSGYPNNLKGKDIPLGARVLAVVDVFDAYTSDHMPNSKEEINHALQMLKQDAGTLFDPEIVSVWESICHDVVKCPAAGHASAYNDIRKAASEDAMALETIRRDATSDTLTGLANRRGFENTVAGFAGKPFSVILFDVDSFKAINDHFGHQAGDAALIRLAGHLQTSFVDAELICRLGGDEFVVVSFSDPQLLRRQIREFRRALVSDPDNTGFRSHRFGISCGIATIPTDGTSVEEVLRKADRRMYAVKMRAKARDYRFSELDSREAVMDYSPRSTITV